MHPVSSQAAILKHFLRSDIAPTPMPSQVVADVSLPAYFVSTDRVLVAKGILYLNVSFSDQVFDRNETERRMN